MRKLPANASFSGGRVCALADAASTTAIISPHLFERSMSPRLRSLRNERSRRSAHVAATTRLELARNLAFECLADLVGHQTDDDDHQEDGRENADRQSNSAQCFDRLRGVRPIAVP